MSIRCCVCKEKTEGRYDRYFVVPGFLMVPNCYPLCEEHKDVTKEFEDFYNPDGSRKKKDNHV